jgi:hypothetical protein
MSLATRVNSFAMRFHRANIVVFRFSKMRPIQNLPLRNARPGRSAVIFPASSTIFPFTITVSMPVA